MSDTRKTWAEKMVADALNDPAPLLRELDAENDEIAVRDRLAGSRYDPWQSRVAEEWLRRKSEARAEARDAENFSIAKEANSIARSQAAADWKAARYAMYAAAIAATAAIVEAKDQILALIFGHP